MINPDVINSISVNWHHKSKYVTVYVMYSDKIIECSNQNIAVFQCYTHCNVVAKIHSIIIINAEME